MSGIWNRTLVYLGLREEPEEMYDDLPERFVPEDDPHAEHAPERPSSRPLAGASASSGGGGVVGSSGSSSRSRVPAVAAAAAGEVTGTASTGSESSGSRRPASAPRGSAGRGSSDDRDTPTRAAAGSDEGSKRSRAREPGEGRPRVSGSRSGAEAEAASNVRSLRTGSDVHVRAVPSSPVARAALIELEVFDDVEAVGARYRTGQPVLFDVSGTDRQTGRRVVDFVSGLTFALRGRLLKVGTGAFLLVPEGVELPADERRRLNDLGYRLPTGSDG